MEVKINYRVLGDRQREKKEVETLESKNKWIN